MVHGQATAWVATVVGRLKSGKGGARLLPQPLLLLPAAVVAPLGAT